MRRVSAALGCSKRDRGQADCFLRRGRRKLPGEDGLCGADLSRRRTGTDLDSDFDIRSDYLTGLCVPQHFYSLAAADGIFEDGSACDQDIRAGLCDYARSIRSDSAVDFEMDREPDLVDGLPEFRNLRHHSGHERLSAEAGFDRHHEDQVDLGKIRQYRGGGRARLEGKPHRAAVPPDLVDRLVYAVAALDVECYVVGSRVGECAHILSRIGEHEMDIERKAACRPHTFHDWRPDGEVRHKMRIHDIDMYDIGPGGIDGTDFLAEPCEVRGEYRRRYEDLPVIEIFQSVSFHLQFLFHLLRTVHAALPGRQLQLATTLKSMPRR